MSVDVSNALLRWYAVDKRRLPWRAEGVETADPYRVWLSEVMLQQTTVAAVKSRFETFVRRWPTVGDLAAADEAEVLAAWAGLGYYARARNLIACGRHVAREHGGKFPSTEAGLRQLPGIGDYTAAAIAAIAFDAHAVVVDSNVERVVSRLFAVKQMLPEAKPTIRRLAGSITPARRCGDFAQAMMDLGATICTPRDPSCGICPLASICEARLEGRPEIYPRKKAKAPRPRRSGRAYWVEHEDCVLLERRAPKGLLGGMLGLPTTGWGRSENPALSGTPQWEVAGRVSHVFTHFALELEVCCSILDERPADGIWWPIGRLHEAGLPTLFAKVAAAAQGWREPLAAASARA